MKTPLFGAAAALAILFTRVLCLVESFDYVIVGAGTCGLLVANRLSQDPDTTVALIDPGADERNNSLVSDPTLFTRVFLSQNLDWAYPSVPQAGAAGRVLTSHAGKGIGGSSLINGMVYIRGDKAQFDAWEELGNRGWNWNLFLRYYKKLERLFPPEPWQVDVGASVRPENHGYEGDLHVGFVPALQNGSFYHRVRASWGALGQGVNRDTLDPGQNRRWDAATAYFWPVAGRPNLHLLNGTATRVLWKAGGVGAEAEGVEYVTPGKERRMVCAKREVILSAGALRTPLILERSGVGNPRLLRGRGIEPVVDSPGVGENLIEQPNLSLIYASKQKLDGASPYAAFVSARDLFGSSVGEVAARSRRSLGQWARQVARRNGGGPGAAAALERIFRIQHGLMFDKETTIAEYMTTAFGDRLVASFWALQPFSRGSVHIRPSGAGGDNGTAAVPDAPAIDTQLLTVDLDTTVQVAAGRVAAQFWSTAPVSDLVADALAPNASDQLPLPPGGEATDAQWRRWARGAVVTNSHPLGTAAMMARELGGVVDPSLAVYGTARLRVVDASVLPMQPSGHLTATLYAVAERAAEMIQAEGRW
ncbi:GMC oxidoreductase domain-containing protein [Hirsutella rhossiliensis]|uniref:GMC oxidoreductase domain-containing protein n=1 Tax=Hirsutella rhossiliensis TaxID=111463 RepID=A0A9P8SJA8_9HYPO|nr:GMC oxidoreductase domain-containing protein [Hirsutella rhossiliensis]KAH0964696.1 GMC oxidoreductase domain-containing protein [Hirsutella rhossiliensis]